MVAKGAKLKNSKFSNIKVPGATFKIEFGGRSELKNLFTCETIGSIIIKESNFKIYLYLNELILKTLELEAPMKMIFNDLINLFKELETVKDPLEKELKLRRFEYGLIVELGYEFSLMDDNIGRKIEGSKFYEFVPNRGFQETYKKGNNTCSGITIINFNNGLTKILAHDTNMTVPIANAIYANFKNYNHPNNEFIYEMMNGINFIKPDIKK